MSPTAQNLLDRPQTADYGLLSEVDVIHYKVNVLGGRAHFATRWPELLDYLSTVDRSHVSSNLPYTKRSEQWTVSTFPASASVEWFAGSYELTVEQDNADYLFEDPLPESVPAEWVAEVERYRSIEREDFVLPWNEDLPRDDVGG